MFHDTTDEFVKVNSIQNQVVLATIDATQQNIKTFNDNAKSFADLNRNILQSWISVFTTKNN
jgi:spore coat polysaccharide biosynthesis protein SpsF (cytidylyltransferase family)